jgi:hypothetical protein
MTISLFPIVLLDWTRLFVIPRQIFSNSTHPAVCDARQQPTKLGTMRGTDWRIQTKVDTGKEF